MLASRLTHISSRRVSFPNALLVCSRGPFRGRQQLLLNNIKTTGPIPFATYMQLCLSHPTHGYYMNPQILPEISQVFGELLGIWYLSQWAASGGSNPIRVIELGPGRGTLMDDIVRVVAKLSRPTKPINIHLVETSSAMRSLQEAKLKHAIENPLEYTMLVAHEFFDALPIHVLQKTEKGWQEVLIDLNPDYNPSIATQASKHRFRCVLSPTPSATSTVLGLSSNRFGRLPIGSTIEVSPASFKIARHIAELLAGNTYKEGATEGAGGCGLIIDYGGDKVFGDSFRAFKEHSIVDIFHRPGESDLTANVDFAFLKESMSDLVSTYGPISQATFLERMGLQIRVDALVRAATSDERKDTIRKGAERLVDLVGMGKDYQVLGIAKQRNQQDVWPFIEVDKLSQES
ncbi:S-adenosyl-L-methionine-dependent methyltransferase [Cyathus striatus]|nr:S-adenosyl-L-methionine-dependent methyltransferase [Cyathus striatus]